MNVTVPYHQQDLALMNFANRMQQETSAVL